MNIKKGIEKKNDKKEKRNTNRILAKIKKKDSEYDQWRNIKTIDALIKGIIKVYKQKKKS